jgi:CrcB protein
MTVLAIVLGAAFGAPLRFIVDRFVTARTAGVGSVRQIPWGLFAVNFTGSVLAGLILALTTGDLLILLLVGFCGAFTTFSGFGWDANRLWVSARPAFWATVIAMPLACIIGFIASWEICSTIAG